jgi:phosphatidylserine/phosphatidylglycerophosphate/cardiolipin synthase-like enzyme
MKSTYVLTDWPVIQALTRAADRGVAIRIYLDGTQLAEREPTKVFNDLAETPGVDIRIKHKSSAPMHLKSYQIDGKLLRTGAANFSASGLKRQDNDLIIIESAQPEASIALGSRQRRIAVAQAGEKRDPGRETTGIWRMSV